ncbi:MAG TPA: hypothetical protein VGP02_20215 [Mycobacteriales bacterium]|nr:hypothetical protein [Mycobacteriales bacterium]
MTAAVGVPGVAVTIPWLWDPAGTIVRWTVLLAPALVAGSAAVRVAGRDSDPDHIGHAADRARL